jgi:hypothetical protein
MDHSAGQSQTAIFAAGPARHRIVRAAVAGGIALLVAWLVALVLGVFGGFESLPLLPDNSNHSNASRVGATDRRPQAAPAVAPDRDLDAKAQTLGTSGNGTTTVAPRHSTATPRVTARPTQRPSSATQVTTSQGHGKGLTQSTSQGAGKPLDSPGNAPGSSGAPGQLR